MNRQQFQLAHHDYRIAKRASGYGHLTTSRSDNGYRDYIAGWQWRMAQIYGEGMAATLHKVFVRHHKVSSAVISERRAGRIGELKDKANKKRVLADAIRRMDIMFRTPNPATSAPVVNPPCSSTNGRPEVVDLLEVCSIFGDAS